MLDFIERHLGVSPDGGDGSIEALLVVLLFTMIAWMALRVGKLPR
jgi:hypothetical protein